MIGRKLNQRLMLATLAVAAVGLVGTASQAATFVASSGNWNTTTNWSSATVPNAIDAVAGGRTGTNNSCTVTLDISPTVGSITTSTTNSTYTINNSGSNTITMDVTSGNAAITASGRNNLSITADILINDNLVVTKTMGTNSETRSVTINGNITGSGTVTLTSATTAGTGQITVSGINNTGSLTVNGDNTGTASIVTVNLIGSNVTTLTKSGSNRLDLGGSSSNTYTGLTSVSNGTVNLNKSGAANAIAGNLSISGGSVVWNSAGTNLVADTAVITMSAGTLNLNNKIDVVQRLNFNGGTLSLGTGRLSLGTEQGSGNGLFVNNGGTLAGGGTLTTPVAINNGGTLAPGSSPGTLTINNADLTWATGGTYSWQILDAAGVAGTGWDLVNVIGTGKLVVTATTGGKFNVVLQSLASIGPDVQGQAANFNPLVNQSWKIASSANAITGWDVADGLASNLFTINTGNFVGAAGNATFFVSKTGNDVFLNYAVPEPASLALLGLGGLLMLPRQRRRQA